MLKEICAYAAIFAFALAVGAFSRVHSATVDREVQELPTYAIMGMPITPVQMQVVGGAHVREQVPSPGLVVDGMPASPHQLAVLTPRSRRAQAGTRATVAEAGLQAREAQSLSRSE